MKRNLKPVIIILVILVLSAVGYSYLSQHPDQFRQLQHRFGLISQAEATGIYTVSGYIEADEIDLAAEVKGRISAITVDEGDFVKTGQTLVELDTALLAAEVQQARASVDTAKAQLAKIKAGVRTEEIGKAEAAVAVAEAGAEAAYTRWQDAIMLRDNPQELDRQIDAAKTALALAELQIAYAIPLKDAGEARWELGKQQWEYAYDEHHACGTNPVTGQKKCVEFELPEGLKQDAGVAWNYAGADMWEAWVDLNSSIANREDAQVALNDLLRLRTDPQEAQLQVAQTEAAYQTALAEVEVAKAQLEILKAGSRAEQIATAQAQVEQAEAALAALIVDRDQHTLAASLDGWVVERTAHEGEMAIPGAALLTLADLSNMTLIVYVPEPDIRLVSIGQKVKVVVDSFPGESFTGQVSFINDEAEFTPKNVQTKEERVHTVFAVKITLENKEQRLKPGMPADAVLAENQSPLTNY
jgi:multidrug efflux pump subunit AcrA (membrane-fusion protein)